MEERLKFQIVGCKGKERNVLEMKETRTKRSKASRQ